MIAASSVAPFGTVKKYWPATENSAIQTPLVKVRVLPLLTGPHSAGLAATIDGEAAELMISIPTATALSDFRNVDAFRRIVKCALAPGQMIRSSNFSPAKEGNMDGAAC